MSSGGRMNHSKYLILTILFFGLLAIPALAATDTASVSVDVASVAAVDINPASFSFSVSGTGQTSTAANFEVENIGSTAISSVYAQVTNAASNPYGTGNAANYDAGDFVLLDNGSGTFYYVKSVNYNESVPAYVTSPSTYDSFVRIRTAGLETTEGEEYFAFVQKGAVDCSNGTVLIAKTPHTQSQTGTTDFSASGTDYATVTLASNVGTVTGVNTVFDAHKIYVPNDCSYVALVKWDQSLGGDYLYSGTLNPGATLPMKMEVKVPYGVAAGSISGTLTIVAS